MHFPALHAFLSLSAFVISNAWPELKLQCEQEMAIDWPQPCWNRKEIVEIANIQNFTKGAEIGVQKGYFARESLAIWTKCQSYSLVDLWRSQKNYTDSANVNDAQQEHHYQTTRANIDAGGFSSLVSYYRNSSLEAATYFTDGSLDYIFLDARHDYCGLSEDLFAWWPKLKVNGLMAGHDFLNANEARRMSNGANSWGLCENGTVNESAVKGAVVEFACKHKLKVFYTREKPPSWYFSPKR